LTGRLRRPLLVEAERLPVVEGQRPYDLVLFGGTGFTGGLTASYLAAHAPGEMRWAVAGRNRAKLEALVARLATEAPNAPVPEILQADAADRGRLDEIAATTRVVITTVGPYILYGEPLVAACAAAGTDYVDLTGEPEFVDRMWLGHHAAAERSGARLIHCCGFDSIPHDLGAYFTVKQLPEGVPLRVDGYVRSNARFSGGTYHSALNIMGRARQGQKAAKERSRLEPRPANREIHSAPARPGRNERVGGWTVPLPTIDGTIIRRSAATVDRYGPNFTYGHHMVAKHLATVGVLGLGVGTVAGLAQLAPTRNLLLKLKAPGEGPSEAERERSWFKIVFLGEGGGETVRTEVSGGDPGYGETSKMLAESGLCLAFDQLPETAGQVTTAAAMGDPLLERLQRAGISFQVIETSENG
jgi:short subunit dehydrogenase-like uncharacterized protein